MGICVADCGNSEKYRNPEVIRRNSLPARLGDGILWHFDGTTNYGDMPHIFNMMHVSVDTSAFA